MAGRSTFIEGLSPSSDKKNKESRFGKEFVQRLFSFFWNLDEIFQLCLELLKLKYFFFSSSRSAACSKAWILSVMQVAAGSVPMITSTWKLKALLKVSKSWCRVLADAAGHVVARDRRFGNKQLKPVFVGKVTLS